VRMTMSPGATWPTVQSDSPAAKERITVATNVQVCPNRGKLCALFIKKSGADRRT
jgi:hypothetical protein